MKNDQLILALVANKIPVIEAGDSMIFITPRIAISVWGRLSVESVSVVRCDDSENFFPYPDRAEFGPELLADICQAQADDIEG